MAKTPKMVEEANKLATNPDEIVFDINDKELWKKIVHDDAKESGDGYIGLKGVMNTDLETCIEHIKANVQLQLPQVPRHAEQDTRVAIVGGGPSINDCLYELRDQVWEGHKVVAVNGSYQWLIEHNIKPNAMIIIDGREFNKRFLTEPVPGCKYFISSQCHPKTFERAMEIGEEVFIWHSINEPGPDNKFIFDYYLNNVSQIVGGTTVMTRAFWVMHILGFKFFDVYGMDSCFIGGEHHGYSQPENEETDVPVKVHVAGKLFDCATWHINQAMDFQKISELLGEHFRMSFHGEGLLSHMVRTGARMYQETQEE